MKIKDECQHLAHVFKFYASLRFLFSGYHLLTYWSSFLPSVRHAYCLYCFCSTQPLMVTTCRFTCLAVTKEEVPILESWKRLSCIKLPPSEELNRLQPPQLIMETPSVRLSLSLSLLKALSLSRSDQDQDSKKTHNCFSLFFLSIQLFLSVGCGWPRTKTHNLVRHFCNRLGHCSQKQPCKSWRVAVVQLCYLCVVYTL